MKCECCRKKEATLKDYRTIDGIHGKVFVCQDCFNLTDVQFDRTMTNSVYKGRKQNDK